MIRATTFAGRRVAVFGLGGSGLSAARALADGDATVLCWDDGETGRTAARDAGLDVVDLSAADWTGIDALVLAPGVPLTHPEPHWVVGKARAAGAQIIGDIEIFFRERAAQAAGSPVVCITGTNGKSTTTALLAHLLRALGHTAAMGGNIGKAILTLDPPSREVVHVIEMSSFQIDLTPTLNPTVGVLLNVSPDHIDRHGTVEHYAAVKERLIEGAEAACVGLDDTFTKHMAERQLERAAGSARVYPFTAGRGAALVPRLYAIGQSLFVHEHEGAYATSQQVASLEGIASLRGTHNVQNALAALAALRALDDRMAAGPAGRGGLPPVWQPDALQGALASFPGLAHRMENVGHVGSALIVNDSKATNADSTEKALAAFPGSIYWIAGGKPKEGGIASLRPLFGRIAKAYLIGAAAEDFARTLDGAAAYEQCGTLDAALAAAVRDAQVSGEAEPVVLLSPACASYDQFKNFEVRGDAFKALARAMPGFVPMGAIA